jgi:hypothetical protein
METCQTADKQAQKGIGSRCHVYTRRGVHPKRPGVEYRPKTTENGHVERGNPPSALSGNAGGGDQAVSLGGVGCPKKPMPDCNGEDMLT